MLILLYMDNFFIFLLFYLSSEFSLCGNHISKLGGPGTTGPHWSDLGGVSPSPEKLSKCTLAAGKMVRG